MIDKLLMSAIDNKKKYYASIAIRTLPIVALTIAQTLTLAYVIDAIFLKHKTPADIGPALLAIILIFTLRPLVQGHFEWFNRRQTSKAKQNLRKMLSRKLSENHHALENENTTGYFATMACDGIESTDAYYSEFVPQLFIMTFNTLFILSVAFYFDWVSALIMGATAPLIPIFMILIGKTAEGVNQKQWQSLKWMNGHLLDLLRGMTTLRYFGKHLQQAESVAKTSDSFRKKTMAVLSLTFLSALALEFTATLSTAVIAVSLGVRLLYGQIEFLPALSILLMAPEYYLPLRQLGLKYHAAMNGKAVSAQLKPIFNLNIQQEKKYTEPLQGCSSATSSALAFDLKDIDFAYGNGPDVIKSFNLMVEKGSSLAITGRSGAGKTTLLKLLLGEHLPNAGKIYLLGQDYKSLGKEDLHRLMAFVPQRSHIFDGTLLDNLRFGRPDATEAEVWNTCMKTGFSKIVKQLPLGLETLLGEGQQTLSGGETQLLAITRACVRETPILILDEPTSALDPISESMITHALTEISKDKTLILAAHRKASVNMCTRIVTLGGDTHENA